MNLNIIPEIFSQLGKFLAPIFFVRALLILIFLSLKLAASELPAKIESLRNTLESYGKNGTTPDPVHAKCLNIEVDTLKEKPLSRIFEAPFDPKILSDIRTSFEGAKVTSLREAAAYPISDEKYPSMILQQKTYISGSAQLVSSTVISLLPLEVLSVDQIAYVIHDGKIAFQLYVNTKVDSKNQCATKISSWKIISSGPVQGSYQTLTKLSHEKDMPTKVEKVKIQSSSLKFYSLNEELRKLRDTSEQDLTFTQVNGTEETKIQIYKISPTDYNVDIFSKRDHELQKYFLGAHDQWTSLDGNGLWIETNEENWDKIPHLSASGDPHDLLKIEINGIHPGHDLTSVAYILALPHPVNFAPSSYVKMKLMPSKNGQIYYVSATIPAYDQIIESTEITPELQSFVKDTPRFDYMSPEVQELKRRVLSRISGERTKMKIIRAIHEVVFPTLPYSWEVYHDFEQNEKPASDEIRTKNTVCVDMVTVFVALARSFKIPARDMSGIVFNLEEGKQSVGLHAWAEINIDNKTWVPLDPTSSQLFFQDSRYIPVVSNNTFEEWKNSNTIKEFSALMGSTTGEKLIFRTIDQ